MSRFDPAMFMYSRNGYLESIVCIDVYDFCWGGTDEFGKCVISKMRDSFLVGSADSKYFKYVGLSILQMVDGIRMDQEGYIKSLKQVDVSHERVQRKDTGLNDSEVRKYRSIVGQLNWIGTQTRPDISYDVCALSTLIKKCTKGDMMDTYKVIKRVKSDQVHISSKL